MRASSPFPIAIAIALVLPAPAAAQESQPCWDRPGNATPSCVLAPRVLAVEVGAVDWSHQRGDDGGVVDTIAVAGTLVRYGIGGATEVRVGFTPYVRSDMRAPGDPASSVADGFGDLTLSVRHRFVDGGDRGTSVAAVPFVSIPTGAAAVSAGIVTGGLTVPVDVPLDGGWSLNLSPTVAAAADADGGGGAHPVYAGVVSVSHAVASRLAATGELFVQRDRDSLGATTQATLDLALAWQPVPRWQVDVASYIGLNRDTPGLRLIGGFAWRF